MVVLLAVCAIIMLACALSCFFGEDEGAVNGSNKQMWEGMLYLLLAFIFCMFAIYIANKY